MKRMTALFIAASVVVVFAIGTANAFVDSEDQSGGPGEAPLDITQNDDVIVEGNVCASDNNLCADGEPFVIGPSTGVEYMALDNVPRIGLVDTDANQDDWILETLGSPERFQIRSWDESTFNTPFAVESRSGDNLVYLDDTYRVGIGTTTPDAQLEVYSAAGAARLVVDEDNPAASKRILLWLQNQGQPAFRMTNNADAAGWELGLNASNQFQINEVGSPSRFLVRASGGLTSRNASGDDVLILGANGNLEIGGVLTQNSDRNAKQNIVLVDGEQVLEQIRGLAVSEWSYAFEDIRHIGPMAQDFHAAFGLGVDGSGLSTMDTSGVALAAIQELADRNDLLEARIAELESSLRDSNATGWELWVLALAAVGAVAAVIFRRRRTVAIA